MSARRASTRAVVPDAAGVLPKPEGKRRIGVYVCHCGGNISDYVDVDRVVESLGGDPDVVVAKTAMFTCSDAGQQEIIKDIEEQKLDGIVVASCSPKLHTFTFRDVAKRGGLSPYQYTQVNLREQCSWTHTDDREGATTKASQLVKAGVGRTLLTVPLEPIVVETVPNTVVIGAGVAGLRAALGLAEIGLSVFLVEKEARPGGWVGEFGEMYPHGRIGRGLIDRLVERVRAHAGITVFTNAEVIGKSGSFGDFEVVIRVNGQPSAKANRVPETIAVRAGSVIVATGFDSYEVSPGEFGYGLDGVITLPDFERLLTASAGPLEHEGRPVGSIVYIYCVGSRQSDQFEHPNEYCSRYCCTAGVHASLRAGRRAEGVRQYHLHRDIRAYGEYELSYNSSRDSGALYLRFPDDEPPRVEQAPGGHGLVVTVRDLLTDGRELAIPADLVVLVTGMVPRANDELVRTLKLPVGKGGFYNEIHPKLRPVETVVDGVYICGACQGPKTSTEAVASGLAAATQSASILKRGFAELDPLIGVVDAETCAWCGLCLEACPYEAPRKGEVGGKEVAFIDRAACKGCGGCVPVCPHDAIDLLGYTDAQIRAMIDGLAEEFAPCPR